MTPSDKLLLRMATHQYRIGQALVVIMMNTGNLTKEDLNILIQQNYFLAKGIEEFTDEETK